MNLTEKQKAVLPTLPFIETCKIFWLTYKVEFNLIIRITFQKIKFCDLVSIKIKEQNYDNQKTTRKTNLSY